MSPERITIEIVMKALRSVADGIRWDGHITGYEVIEALQGAADELEEQLREINALQDAVNELAEQLREIDDEENVR